MHDIAQIKSLLPELVSFAYIDSQHLRVHAAAAADEDEDDRTSKRERKNRELDEAYRAGGVGEEAREMDGKKTGETVLLFSFHDGELKSDNGVGKIFNRKFSYVSSELLHSPLLIELTAYTGAGARRRVITRLRRSLQPKSSQSSPLRR